MADGRCVGFSLSCRFCGHNLRKAESISYSVMLLLLKLSLGRFLPQLTSPGWKGYLGIALNAKSFRRLTSVSFGWRHQTSVSLLWFLSAKDSVWVSCGLSGMDIYSMWKGTEPTVCWIQQLSFSKAVCLLCQCEGDMQPTPDVKNPYLPSYLQGRRCVTIPPALTSYIPVMLSLMQI